MLQLFPFTLFLPTELIAVEIAQKHLKTPQTSAFPGSGSHLCCLSSQQSAGIFFSSSCLPVKFSAERKRERVNFYQQIHSLLKWLLLLFSPDLDLQVQMYLSVYKLVPCLFILEDLTSSWICQKFKFPHVLCQFKWGLFSTSWLVHLSGAVASYGPCWLFPAYQGLVLDWNDWRGKDFGPSLVLDQTRWLLKPPALSDCPVSHSFEFDIELKKCQSLHFDWAGTATWNFCAYTSDLIANTTNLFLT